MTPDRMGPGPRFTHPHGIMDPRYVHVKKEMRPAHRRGTTPNTPTVSAGAMGEWGNRRGELARA